MTFPVLWTWLLTPNPGPLGLAGAIRKGTQEHLSLLSLRSCCPRQPSTQLPSSTWSWGPPAHGWPSKKPPFLLCSACGIESQAQRQSD